MKIFTTIACLFLFQNILCSQSPGTLDPDFGSAGKAFPNLGASADAGYQILALPDGSVLLGGGTKYTQRWEFAIAKRLPDGSPDTTFGADQQDWIRNPGVKHYGDYAYDLEMQDMALFPNGRIICVGIGYRNNHDGTYSYNPHAQMFLPNGVPVSGWTLQSFPTTSAYRLFFAVKVQPDGKFLVGAIDPNNQKLEIGRFMANGFRDVSFGVNGAVSIPVTGGWTGYGVHLALMADGKILAVTSSNNTSNSNIFLARFLPNGQLDTGFGTSGIATIDVGDMQDIPQSILPLPDGKIMITGWTLSSLSNSAQDVLLIRLLSNGQPDPSFGTAGHRIHAISSDIDFAQQSILLPDGKILMTGYAFNSIITPSTDRAFALRFLPNGDLDPNFANNGIHWMDHPNNTAIYGLASLPNGSAVLGGFSINPASGDDFLLEAIDSSGFPDPNFGADGIVDLPLDGGIGALQTAVCLPDGKILVAGTAYNNFSTDFCVGRLLPDGSTDPTFGADGIAFAGFSNYDSNDYGEDMAITPDGKIVLAGFSDSLVNGNNRIAIACFLPNGLPDNNFNQNGKLSVDWSTGDDELHAVTVQPDGKIVVAGDYNGSDFAVARFLVNGKTDPGFGIAGLKHWPMGTSNNGVSSLSLLPDGSILVAGDAHVSGSDVFSIAKLNPNGSFDPSFGVSGMAFIQVPENGDASSCNDIAVQPNGKILLTGSVNFPNDSGGIATLRLLANGIPDSLFGANAWAFTGINDNDITPNASSIKLQSDGKILLAGIGGSWSKVLAARLLPNGTPDPDFGDGGIYLDEPDTLNISGAASISLQPDGKIVLAGFTTPDLTNVRPLVYRLISGLNVGVIDRPQRLSQPLIYPNPVMESEITVKYELPGGSAVRIELLDLQGKALAALLHAERNSGENTETLHLPTGLASGIYLLNIQTERGNAIVKVNILNH